ncbi:ABC transporter ATP-binding protein [Salinibacter altiplanensis]|uniref:ATP-binding cassette domain-containing protein n=1 Tax=Salinibacter altiplanensis TaxID=1803181 RepID=UPI000C9EF533|nr:ABC transporter ATP-binding protein [Salinibacter altiplanensis]
MAVPLTLDALSKRYGDGPSILSSLSRSFEPGTLTLLVGPNGAGKTTLLRLLAVQAYPTSGTVRYGEIDVHDAPYRYLQRVGLVHAGPELPEHLTAEELLEWILRSRGQWTDEEGSARIAALLDRLRLDERRENLIGTYSSGMTQKAQVAAAFVAEPAVVLMDEPLRSLDTATTEATVDLLNEFVADGGLALVASHLTDALRPHADAVVRLGEESPVSV